MIDLLTILAVLSAGLATPLPANVPYGASPASPSRMHFIGGGWRNGPFMIRIEPTGPGRAIVTTRFLELWSREINFVTEHRGAIFVSVPARETMHDHLMTVDPPKADDCLLTMRAQLSSARLVLTPIDVAATLRANSWIDARTANPGACANFLGGLSPADQARLTIVSRAQKADQPYRFRRSIIAANLPSGIDQAPRQ